MKNILLKLDTHQTLITNIFIFCLNFSISIFYAQNLTVEDRGVLVAAILYPQLAIGLFSFGLLRSIPSFLKKHIFKNFTQLQLTLCIVFVISSMIFLYFMESYFQKPIYRDSYLYPTLSAASTILMLSVLARGKELAYNIFRSSYHVILLISIFQLKNVENIIQSIVICNAIIGILALTFIRYKTEVQESKSENDITKGLLLWSLLTTINSNALILVIDFVAEPATLAIIAITFSFFKLQNLYVSSVSILAFFQQGDKGVDVKRKSKILFLINIILFVSAPFLIPNIYGEDYFRFEIVSIIVGLVFLLSLNELLIQDFYRKGNLGLEIISKFIMGLGLCLIYILSYYLNFNITEQIVICLFIVIELMRTFLLLTYRVSNA